MAGYGIRDVIETSSPVALSGLIGPEETSYEEVDLLIKENSAAIELVDPAVSSTVGVALPAKAAGGADVPAGTYRIKDLLRYELVGDSSTVVLVLVEAR